MAKGRANIVRQSKTKWGKGKTKQIRQGKERHGQGRASKANEQGL